MRFNVRIESPDAEKNHPDQNIADAIKLIVTALVDGYHVHITHFVRDPDPI